MNRITHIIPLHEAPEFNPFSGAENHLFVLMQAQQARGMDVALFALVLNPGAQLAAKFEELRAHGIRVEAIPYRPALDWRAVWRLRGLLRERGGIVHTHLDYGDLNGKLAAWLAGCRRVLATVHNQEMQHQKLKWYVIIHLLDRLTRRYIAITPSVSEHMRLNEKLPAEKIRIVRYGVPVPAHVESRESLRKRYDLPENAFVIGYVGRFTEQKNLPLLLDVLCRFKEKPDVYGVLVGSGELFDDIARQVQTLDLQRAILTGVLLDAADIMPLFDVLCLPSRWEGLGLVLLEAMLRHVPVVGSRAGAIPDVLNEGEAGLLFDSDNAAGLYQALRRLYESPDLRRSLAERAYAHVLQNYSVDAMLDKTQAVYEELTP